MTKINQLFSCSNLLFRSKPFVQLT